MNPRSLRNEWRGSDVWIIGGGPSLRSFDWGILKGKHTIGCNSAYKLGSASCSVCLFSDEDWWNRNEKDLDSFGGTVVTSFEGVFPKWVHKFNKSQQLSKDSLLYGSGGNTGASAINLALIMGAKNVLLLGFDGKRNEEGKANWHAYYNQKDANDEVYHRFLDDFRIVACQQPVLFPNAAIWNLNPDSAISLFQKADIARFL